MHLLTCMKKDTLHALIFKYFLWCSSILSLLLVFCFWSFIRININHQQALFFVVVLSLPVTVTTCVPQTIGPRLFWMLKETGVFTPLLSCCWGSLSCSCLFSYHKGCMPPIISILCFERVGIVCLFFIGWECLYHWKMCALNHQHSLLHKKVERVWVAHFLLYCWEFSVVYTLPYFTTRKCVPRTINIPCYKSWKSLDHSVSFLSLWWEMCILVQSSPWYYIPKELFVHITLFSICCRS